MNSRFSCLGALEEIIFDNTGVSIENLFGSIDSREIILPCFSSSSFSF